MSAVDRDVTAEAGAVGAGRAGDLDMWTIAGMIWARRRLVLWTTGIVVVLAGAVLLSITPRYSSEAKILIENRESRFTRTTADSEDQFLSDQAAVLSQVEVLSSRDLATSVVDELELASNPEFNRDPAGESVIGRLLVAIGLRQPVSADETTERAVEIFAEQLTVYQVGTSRVIAVEFASVDAERAAAVANALTEKYIAVQRVNKFDTNQDAIAWLGGEIEQLRERVAEAEANVAEFRSESGLYETGRETSISEQQLADLSAELIRASAARSEARAKARMVNQLLEEPGSIEEAAAVLSSQLIQRLREQQAAVSREHAELSATLLPNHPRMRQLTAELADLDERILDEARKIARGLENEAELAGARVEAIRESLSELKATAGETTQAEVKLRALAREAAAQREILESFLRRYREATSRQDVEVQTADARIISRASVPTGPSYPPRGPILALASVVGVLLGLMAAVIADMVSPAARTVPAGASPLPVRGRWREEVRRLPSIADSAEVAETATDIAEEKAGSGEEAPEAAGRPERGSAQAGEPLGHRLAQIVSTRGIRRVAILRSSGAGSSVDVAVRAGEEVAASGSNPVVIEVVPDAAPAGTGPGLYDVLGGKVALGQALATAGERDITMIRAGGREANSDELVRSGRVSLVVDALLRRFDLAVIAAGSLTGGEVPIAVASACDYVLIAFPPGEVSERRMKAAIRQLKKSGIGQAAVVSEGAEGLTLHECAPASGEVSDAA